MDLDRFAWHLCTQQWAAVNSLISSVWPVQCGTAGSGLLPRGSKGGDSVNWPAGELEAFFVHTLEQRKELQSLSSASKPAAPSETSKSWLGKEKVHTMKAQLIGSAYLASYKYSWEVISIFQKHKKFCFFRVAVAHILQGIKKKAAWHGFLGLNYLHERLMKLDPYSIIKRLFTMVWNKMLSGSV